MAETLTRRLICRRFALGLIAVGFGPMIAEAAQTTGSGKGKGQSSSKGKSKSSGKTKEKGKAKTAEKEPEPIAEMKDFLAKLDGTSEATDAALAKHAATGADTLPMVSMMLENPKILKSSREDDQDVYEMKAKTGIFVRTYRMTWKDKKITAIKELSMENSDGSPAGS